MGYTSRLQAIVKSPAMCRIGGKSSHKTLFTTLMKPLKKALILRHGCTDLLGHLLPQGKAEIAQSFAPFMEQTKSRSTLLLTSTAVRALDSLQVIADMLNSSKFFTSWCLNVDETLHEKKIMAELIFMLERYSPEVFIICLHRENMDATVHSLLKIMESDLKIALPPDVKHSEGVLIDFSQNTWEKWKIPQTVSA